MMSPLSIAQFLDPEGLEFDLVIMDEASQIKPEDALGTILRAKQLVVVGDPKQLPPTSFFDRVSDDVDGEEATQFDNTESILEVAMKAFQPVRRLRWHYRSQHESLIHFSNDRFYDGDLVVFPSASTDTSRLGIRHHYVENAKFQSGQNIQEAKAVAEAIAEHARLHPDETLGIGTFNRKQRDLIRDCLDKLCEQDSAIREAVVALDAKQEGIFIKNLENLQGDERDVIFISYTYGPDPDSGQVHNRFGPITGQFGWRRLNVLITRARRRVEVFSSMLPSDIHGGPDKSLGVNSMKDYLDFAKVGILPDRGVRTNRGIENAFELSIARVITRMGLEVVPQVGVAGYFIDLGVVRPGNSGDFLLGVDCDGATYHSSKSARDRDRLREEVIRLRGWNLHRIWSTDWFLNQQHEEERLQQAILKALSGDDNNSSNTS
jgi:very-short-patch-repair endonuclease